MQKQKKSGRGPTLFHTTVTYIYIHIYKYLILYIKYFFIIFQVICDL